MLKKRIIPVVLIDGFGVIKTIGFDQRRNLGSPITVVETYNSRAVDEMLLLDIDASGQGRSLDLYVVRELSRFCFMPLTVGGGLKTCLDVEQCFRAGADKVVLNSVCFTDPSAVEIMAKEFGEQSLVLSLDVKRVTDGFMVRGCSEVLTDVTLRAVLKSKINLGFGEVLVTSMLDDGAMNGGDYSLAKICADASSVPVIYCGGINSPDNSAVYLSEPNVGGIGVSSLFHFTSVTPRDLRQAALSSGIPMRSV